MIGTHDSATGEKAKGLISHLITPFAKTQTKTIIQQYDAGCRYFDIRTRYENGKLILAHGMWKAKKDFETIICELGTYATSNTYVSVMYEGSIDDADSFIEEVVDIISKYPLLILTYIAVKKPKWKVLKYYNRVVYKSSYKNLDGSTWHSYLPIPWLWNKVYYKKHDFNCNYFLIVDFL